MSSSGQGGGTDGLSAECRDMLGEQAGAYVVEHWLAACAVLALS